MIKTDISIAECREILGKDFDDLPDQKIAGIRDSISSLCESVLDDIFENSPRG